MSSFSPGKKKQSEHTIRKAFREDLPARSHGWVFLLLVLGIAITFLTFFTKPLVQDKSLNPNSNQKARDYLKQYRLQQEQLQKALEKLDPFTNPQAVSETIPDDIAPGYVRVASAQFFSRFNKKEINLKRMEIFIKKAAEKKTQIIVFPEAATCGYADLNKWNLWAADPKAAALVDNAAFFHPVENIAESANGQTSQLMSKLAKENHIMIAYGYIEKATDGKYFSALRLIDANGQPLANYRKKRLWERSDPFWATASTEKTWQTVTTEHGKIGLLISYDFNPGIRELGKLKADIILLSSSFYGDNLLPFFTSDKFLDMVKKSSAALVMANWANPYVGDWGGYGLSRVIAPGGMILAARGANPGEFLVMNDLPMKRINMIREQNRLQEQQQNQKKQPQESKKSATEAGK